ncbi:serine-threonine protein kinase, putative [Entamoeba invadens IP1]|uniref:Serine-threonine protein kinase, putative n=1 Tax=Entamoeba invadens IP1 TaxID=370355 RepID=L7FL82_ENTIV|nr:serine-threonine protein kinase, putative [Entamoeba invadens IP1]ELP87616.1 serine-threonine protein kinase, putative [Entamoeba invadens IP1]|eukprot:XP_004254387.1 serine-threonine protein kinase, putative [Entamoeba invadens IP1]
MSILVWMYYFVFLILETESYICPSGCKTPCTSDYTCRECEPEFDNDNTCLHCAFVDSQTVVAYLPQNDTCLSTTNQIVKPPGEFIPSDEYIIPMEEGVMYPFTIDFTSKVDYSFCYFRQKFRLGQWFKIDLSKVTKDYVMINFKKETTKTSNVYVDITNEKQGSQNQVCFAHTYLDESTVNYDFQIPVAKAAGDLNPAFYIFVSVKGNEGISLSTVFTSIDKQTTPVEFVLDQEKADALAKDLTSEIFWEVPFEQKGIITIPVCFSTNYAKDILFTVQFKGDYYILIDSTVQNRVNYLQEIGTVTDDKGVTKPSCVQAWDGYNHGVLSDETNVGSLAMIKGNNDTLRHFSIVSHDQKASITVSFKAICPKNCNFENGFGACSTIAGGCVCKDGYGGDDCHLKCYYKGVWNVDSAGKCLFGSANCDQYCQCSNGATLTKDNLCVTQQCLSGGPGDLQCYRNSEGCHESCQCFINYGYHVTEEHYCKNILCGNNKSDIYYDDKGNFIREEDCDGGLNCDNYCRCVEGYIPDPNDKLSCIKKTITSGAIAGLVIGCVAGVVIVSVILFLIIFFGLTHKKIDIDTFKHAQPCYHFYINGSVRGAPSKQTKYYINPIELDYGNTTVSTAIFDTRFEKMEVKNYSKNKYMMIIFHTPICPKYVFYFDPQVLIIPPRRTDREITSYCTLHCTTRLRGLKIPYTVWFSKSRKPLVQVSELLKGKNFDTWTNDNQQQMEKLSKQMCLRLHHQVTITTDAASSTHIDMDELNMSEKPIAEGAMGKVYIGSYRSVPVAIKQFKWDNLNDEEIKELKKEVMAECEIMGRLRNPFVAGYMGSVTYLPQVSMVIQFFVLGSLGEYLRQDKEDYMKFSYKLKVRLLFDTARGMQFLHENKIMHLDLKPDNLLMNSFDPNSACTVKITDFGTSRFTKKTIKNQDDKGLGTPIYAAPETYKDEYTFAGDVYSFGITAWEIFYQEEPFKGFKSIFEIKQHVLGGKRLAMDKTVPYFYETLIEDCWKQEPSARPSFDQVSKKIVKIDDDVSNHTDLDSGYTLEKVEETSNKRYLKMQKQLSDLSRD